MMSKVISKSIPVQFETYDELALTACNCVKCELHIARKNVVFSSGPENAKVFIIGEAPGAEEDETSVPFIGRSGKLMNTLLAEVGISRDDCYVTSVLKCRPPENRNPKSGEIALCSPYLMEQIRFVQPKVIITVGNFSARFILNTKEGIMTLRGQQHKVGNSIVVPTVHPAYVLRNGARGKAEMLEDLQKVKNILDES